MSLPVARKGGGDPVRRAVGYLRVSIDAQAERGMGLHVQRERVREYAKAKSLELLKIVQETASGGVRNGEEFSWEHRPALLELMELARAGEYEALIVAKLDRLSRDYATLVALARRFQKRGVEILSVAEENGDGPLAELIRGQLALVAQLERAMILERVGAGKAAKKKLGRHVHGRVPYGYRSVSGVLEPLEELVPVVRRIFADAKDGYSPGRIARELSRDGIPAPQGGTWSAPGVRVILSNLAYTGERYGVKRAHPAIVSRRTWNAVQSALELRARSRPQ